MTYEDNKTKRSTLPIVGCVCNFASDLCFLDDIQLRTLVFVDGKFLWFFKKSNNSKTMETTKEEMIMLLRELQDLQMWLLNSGRKFSLIITLYGNLKIFASVVGLTYRGVNLSNRKPFNENVANLKDFIDFVKEKEYECRKSESNHTPTGKGRV